MSVGKPELELGESTRDTTIKFVRVGVSLIPMAGSAISELINTLIPNQRIQRIEAYCMLLQNHLERLKHNVFSDPENIDLFEDGAFQAVRATSRERIDYIASAVNFGLSGENTQKLQVKRILKILEDIDDSQIVILASMLYKNLHDTDFHNRHETTLRWPVPTSASSREELDASVSAGQAREALVRQGLIRENFNLPKHGQAPQFDRLTGRLKASGLEITPLGVLLLRRIGLATEEEF